MRKKNCIPNITIIITAANNNVHSNIKGRSSSRVFIKMPEDAKRLAHPA